MKKIALLLSLVLIGIILFAQDEPKSEPKKKPSLVSRANDHLLLQFGYTSWAGIPDSINTKGFPRSFNAYFLFDFPFKSNPKISVAIGAGSLLASPQQLHRCAIRPNLPVWQEAEELVVSW